MTSEVLGSPIALDEVRGAVAARMGARLAAYRGGVYELAAYHLGWVDAEGRAAAGDGASGKMLRPALCVIASDGFGGARDGAGDAAAALELLHAFSLVHDDIEDGDTERRGRPTLWALRGVPLAINAGDCLFALAHRVMDDAVATLRAERAWRALRIFDDACLRMIEGQHFDLEYESRADVAFDDYLRMSAGKTGALVGASLAIGAIFGGACDADVERMREAGVELGLAFQAVDDALSEWGDGARTGKAVGNDVARGKKALPAVVRAARARTGIERRTAHGNASGASAPDRGEDASVRGEVMRISREHAERARALLAATAIDREGRERLDEVIEYVLRRDR